jgi:DNA-binding response OmpR family regulator
VAGEKILILEDDPLVARVYEKALRHGGNEVTVCTKFEDARQHLRQVQPDAVLTDIRVGAYNGLQLAHLFRTYSPNGKVVVVTGYDDKVLRNEVADLNGEYILKPVTVTQLQSAFAANQQLSTY